MHRSQDLLQSLMCGVYQSPKHGCVSDPQAAFVEYLNGSFLFDSMYAEDTEGNRLASLSGVSELLEVYPSKI